MGADLIVAFVSLDRKKTPKWGKGFAFIDKLAKKPMKDWPAEYRERMACDDPDFCDGNPGTHIEDLKKRLTNLKQAWEGGFRDTVLFDVGGKTVLLTGGMSWGDTPGETFDDIETLLIVGVVMACGFDK